MARDLIPGDATIKAIKPSEKRKRLNDGDGLYLLLFVKGGSRTVGGSTTPSTGAARH